MTDTRPNRICSSCKLRPSYRYLKCKRCRGQEERNECPDCGGLKGKYSKRCADCHRKIRGEEHVAWRGGRNLDYYGYVRVASPGHPKATKGGGSYVKEHVIVMEEHLGRYLLPRENVHHINGIKTDNRIENLELWSTAQPSGQRVEDRIDWAIEIIKTYRPNLLSDYAPEEHPEFDDRYKP